ncbi:MAG: helix-turn-helix domain-containing protein [Polyangiales bacterium]
MAQKKRSSDRPRSTASLSLASRDVPSAAAASPSIGPGVQRLRTQRGLSRAALAAQVGVSEAELAEVESGAREASIDLTWSLANALGVSFSALVRTPAEPAKPPAPPRGIVSRRALLPTAPQRGRSTEVHELKLAAHGSERAEPNPHGTQETLLVTAGRVIVQSDAERHVLGVGDSLVFRESGERFYLNPGETDAVIYSMVAPA